jgi:D-lactate dehydrogenase
MAYSVPMTTVRAVLSGTLPFSAARPETLDALAAGAVTVDVASGAYAFREGDLAPWLFLVLSGELAASTTGDDGASVVHRHLRAGDMGGLTSIDVPRGRSASLRALAPSVLLTLDKGAVRAALASDRAFDAALLTHLGALLRAKTRQVATLLGRTERDPREKVAFFDTKPYEREAFEPHLGDALRVRWIEPRLDPTTAALAEGCPVVCAFVNDQLDDAVLARLSAGGTGLVALRCAGYNHVDRAAAQRHGIDVVRVPAYSPHAVAEHAAALLLTVNRRIHRAHARVREGNFSLNGLVAFNLHGKTAGLVGFGQIGQRLAAILAGFGMTVLASDVAPDHEAAARLGVTMVPLEEIVVRADVISLHAPLLPSTHHLIDEARVAQMKRGALLINTSRGGLVDTRALIEGLKSGHLGGAGLDVYEEESAYFFRDGSDRAITDDVLARLLTFPNVIVTSHQGFLTHEALDAIATTTLDSVRRWLDGARGEALQCRVV